MMTEKEISLLSSTGAMNALLIKHNKDLMEQNSILIEKLKEQEADKTLLNNIIRFEYTAEEKIGYRKEQYIKQLYNEKMKLGADLHKYIEMYRAIRDKYICLKNAKAVESIESSNLSLFETIKNKLTF